MGSTIDVGESPYPFSHFEWLQYPTSKTGDLRILVVSYLTSLGYSGCHVLSSNQSVMTSNSNYLQSDCIFRYVKKIRILADRFIVGIFRYPW